MYAKERVNNCTGKGSIDIATVVMVHGTGRSCLSGEHRGRVDEAERGGRMLSRYLGATSENNKQYFVFNVSRAWKPVENVPGCKRR